MPPWTLLEYTLLERPAKLMPNALPYFLAAKDTPSIRLHSYPFSFYAYIYIYIYIYIYTYMYIIDMSDSV